MKLQKTSQEEYRGDLSIDAQKYVVNELSFFDSD